MTIEEILAALAAIIESATTDDGAERSLTDEEVKRYEQLEAQLATARRDVEIRSRQTAYETVPPANIHVGTAAGAGVEERSNPLAYTQAALDELQHAISARTAVRVDGDVEERAALTTGTYGAPRVWGANVIGGPRLLHVAAGVPEQPSDAIFAQFPQLTLPTATAAVGETVSLTEYASSAAGSVTLGRFGRWTDLSGESLIGATSGAIVGMHTIGIAKDLDKVLIDAVETAAGAAVAFSADVPAAIRSAIARVIDATQEADVTSLVCLVHPDNAALLQDVTPIGGATIAEPFQRFAGALVYPSSAVNTGFITVANLRAGVRFFEAMGVRTATDTAVKTEVLTVATATMAGYALGLAGGFASMVDVVTP